MYHKKITLFLSLLCLACLLLATPVAAANITGATVENTNIYANSNVFDIGPANSYTDSTASGITNVAGRYLYASGISAAVDGDTATFSLITRQGSTTINATLGTAQGYLWEYGDGTTGTADTHTYEIGIYTANLTISNELTESPITLSTRLQIGETTINVSLSAAEIGTGGSWTLNAQTQNAETVQWQVKTPGSTTWQNISGSTYTPTTYGSYQFRAIANGLNTQVISDTLSGTYEASIQGCTVENTNIYANSNVFDIGPANSYTDSTVSGITNVAGRYLYASALTAAVDGPSAVYTISGLQGSTTIEAEQGTAQGYLWEYGDGTTGNTDSLEHLYRESGTYQTNLTLTNYLDSTGITLQANTLVFGPYIGNFEVDKTAGAINQPFNFTVIALDTTSIDWYLARYSDGQWYVITDAHGTTLSYAPNQYGDWYFRAKATNSQTGFTQYTDTIKITVYRPPTILNTAINPANGPLTNTITLSATVETPGGTPQLQWQKSSDGTTWTNIEGATTSTWVGSQTFASGKHYYRLTATGAGGTSYGPAVTYTAYGAPVFSSVQASASIVALPGSVTLTASASDTNTYTWQEQINGQWVQIGEGNSLTQRLTSAGIHNYRVVAVGYGGTTTSSTVSVDAGYKPEVTITSPENGKRFNVDTTLTFAATVSGATSYVWDFGDTTHTVVSQSGTTSLVNYTAYGYKDIKFSATNKYGTTTAGIAIYIASSDRPIATTPLESIDTSAVDNFVNQFDVVPGEMPNIVSVIMSMYDPLDDALKGFFWVFVFGAIMLVIWLTTKSVAIPSVLGILFGAFMVSFMPDMYMMPAAALIAAGCIGGVIYVITKH